MKDKYRILETNEYFIPQVLTTTIKKHLFTPNEKIEKWGGLHGLMGIRPRRSAIFSTLKEAEDFLDEIINPTRIIHEYPIKK